MKAKLFPVTQLPSMEEDPELYRDYGNDMKFSAKTARGECGSLKNISKTKRNESNGENDNNNNNTDNHFNLPVICDADSLRTLIRKKAVRVVDVRKVEDYQQEHIPTAVSLPLAQLLEEETPVGIHRYFAGLEYSR